MRFLTILLMLYSFQAQADNSLIYADYSDRPTSYDYNEYMEINIPESEVQAKWWQITKSIEEDGLSTFEWIPKNERMDSRSEILSIQFMAKKLKDGKPSTAKELVINIFKGACLQFPDMEWNTIQDDDTDFIYEWNLPHGAEGGMPRQHEITRIISTDKGFHRIAYEKRVPKLDPQTRQLWLSRIGSSRLYVKDAR